MKKALFPMASVLLLWSCGGSAPNPTAMQDLNDLDSIQEMMQPDESTMTTEMANEIIKTIPSPIELTSLIKASGAEYSSKLLNNADNVDEYTTNYKRALNLGIYGADLGYINLYEKTHTSMSYINAVRDLADELKVGQFFDFESITRLANNKSNLDSILYITTSGFEDMDEYLKDKNRGNQSMLILVGGWIEALHIVNEVAQNAATPSEELHERIGEQKIVLDDLVLLLEVYKNQPHFQELIDDLTSLQEVYGGVSITYDYQEPEMKEVDGVLVIIDNSSSQVEISPETLKTISNKVKEIRSKMIS